MTRTGKIARLPRSVRDELNCRLDNGESGPRLLAWLNARKDVRAVLKASFAGSPINQQNLSDWKLGGFQDWLRLQDARDFVCALADESAALDQQTGHATIIELLSAPLALALGRCFRLVADAPGDPANQRTLLALAREFSWLRRSEQADKHLQMDCQRWLLEVSERRSSRDAEAAFAPAMQSILSGQLQQLQELASRKLNRPNPPASPPPAASPPPSASPPPAQANST